MTSNLGSYEIKDAFQSNIDFTKPKIDKRKVLQLLKNTVRRVLNRIDDIIMFSPLTAREIKSIVDLQFKILAERLKHQGIEIFATDEAIVALAELGFDPEYGGRPVKRIIQKNVLIL